MLSSMKDGQQRRDLIVFLKAIKDKPGCNQAAALDADVPAALQKFRCAAYLPIPALDWNRNLLTEMTPVVELTTCDRWDAMRVRVALKRPCQLQ